MSKNLTQELLDLQTEFEEAKTKQAKAKGACEQIVKQIKKEFNCSISKAGELLETLKKKEAKTQKEFDDGLTAYKKKYKAYLKDIGNENE